MVDHPGREADIADAKVELPGSYSIDIFGGQLVVFGCDCCERIESVEKAREVMALIQSWIDAPDRTT